MHTHSQYSLLDGLQTIDDIVMWHKNQGEKYAALTDHGFMYGVLEFYNKCIKEGIKPVIGVEFYFTSRTAGSRELGAEERQYQHHLTLLCKNNTGYRNMLKLATHAATKGFYYNPCIDDELLKQHHEGLIMLSGCPSSIIPSLLREGKYDEAKQRAIMYRELFGDDFYIELMKHPVRKFSDNAKIRKEQKEFVQMQDLILDGLNQISSELSIPAVATNDAHYCKKEDAHLHDIVFAMSQGKKVNDEDRMRYPTDEFYMKTEEEMLEIFPAEVVHRSVEIAEKCDVRIEEVHDDEHLMPTFPKLPDGMDEEAFLKKLCREGMDRLGLTGKQEYEERLEHELEVVLKLGWPGYFLILWDVIRWCRENDIPTGPGRGSAAGSLISYTLGITKLDPLEHGMLFERFLNEDRIKPPDIDVDISMEHRDEVIQYVTDLYGYGNVAQIGTMNMLATKAAIKKLSTAFEVPFDKANMLTSYITNKQSTELSVEKALEIPEVKKMYDSDPEIRRVINLAKQLENRPSHVGIHAAGVVISPVPIVGRIPLREVDGALVTQYNMDEVESVGMLKMDFLGLKTLDVIDYCIKEVERNRGIKIDIDKIDVTDEQIYDLMSKADVTGVFQMESNLCRGYLVKMRPKKFRDVVDFISLVRPGPLDAPAPNGNGTMVDEFIRRMHGQSPPQPPHPKLKDVLRDTHGIIVYQEQLMKITQILAGFSGTEADVFRDVVGKKKVDKMPIQKEKFIKGCMAQGMDRAEAEKIMSLLETFARYGLEQQALNA